MHLIHEDVLIEPLVTEHSWSLQEEGKYAFRVHAKANKIQIRKAIEAVFEVDVVKVWTHNYKGKPRRRRIGQEGSTRSWKKAIVQLQVGQRLDIYQ